MCVLTILFLAAFLPFQEEGARTVAQLIEGLKSDNVEEREQAEAKLKALGKNALLPLEEVAKSIDRELAVRVDRILQGIRSQMAKELFESIETKIKTAKALRIRVSSQREFAPGSKIMEGTIEFVYTATGKMFADLVESTPRGTIHHTMVSNNDIVCLKEKAEWDKRRAPFNVGEKLSAAVVRAGPLYWWETGGGKFIWDPRGAYVLSDFRFGPSDPKSVIVQYKLSDESFPALADMTLWLDPITQTPLKRKCEARAIKTGTRWAITETYEEFIFNPDIPEDKFKLPE